VVCSGKAQHCSGNKAERNKILVLIAGIPRAVDGEHHYN